MTRPLALVVGVGAERGLGAAVARRFATAGFNVVLAGRTAAKLDAVATAMNRAGHHAQAHLADATNEADMIRLFDHAFGSGGVAPMRERADEADVVVFNAGIIERSGLRDVSVAQFEEVWRVCCLGGFLVAREAARHLAPRGRGTVLFTGASASLRGKENYAPFAAAKAGLRMVTQSMAREFGPQGLHVAHIVIDGGIDGDRLHAAWPDAAAERGADGLLDIDAIADTYLQLHRQHRSAWTQELDLRPFRESF
jgi:NAD(P)-dependent dehydrogenase (short-subunit alcohol dehydrogenase family)